MIDEKMGCELLLPLTEKKTWWSISKNIMRSSYSPIGLRVLEMWIVPVFMGIWIFYLNGDGKRDGDNF